VKFWRRASSAFMPISVRVFPHLAKGGLGGVVPAEPSALYAISGRMDPAELPAPGKPLSQNGSDRRGLGSFGRFRHVGADRLSPATPTDLVAFMTTVQVGRTHTACRWLRLAVFRRRARPSESLIARLSDRPE